MSDLDGRCFVRRGSTLTAADFAAQEMLDDIPNGREIIITARRPRSPANHRHLFAMLRKVTDNIDRWRSEDELLDALKLATGHCERRMTIDGKVYLAPKSINFASMKEDEFRRFKNRCVHILCQELGWDPTDLDAEVSASQRAA